MYQYFSSFLGTFNIRTADNIGEFGYLLFVQCGVELANNNILVNRSYITLIMSAICRTTQGDKRYLIFSPTGDIYQGSQMTGADRHDSDVRGTDIYIVSNLPQAPSFSCKFYSNLQTASH